MTLIKFSNIGDVHDKHERLQTIEHTRAMLGIGNFYLRMCVIDDRRRMSNDEHVDLTKGGDLVVKAFDRYLHAIAVLLESEIVASGVDPEITIAPLLETRL